MHAIIIGLLVSFIASRAFSAEEKQEGPIVAQVGLALENESVTIHQGDLKFNARAGPWRAFFDVPVRVSGLNLRIAPELSYRVVEVKNQEQPFQQLEGHEVLVGGNFYWRLFR